MKYIAVRENHLYRKAYVGGKKAFGKYCIVYVLKDLKAYALKKANPQKQYVNRIGLTVTKKIGHAVVRSRVRRILRAGFALTERELPLRKGFIIVIAARESAVNAKSTDIHKDMVNLFKKVGMVKQEDKTEASF